MLLYVYEVYHQQMQQCRKKKKHLSTNTINKPVLKYIDSLN